MQTKIEITYSNTDKLSILCEALHRACKKNNLTLEITPANDKQSFAQTVHRIPAITTFPGTIAPIWGVENIHIILKKARAKRK